MLKFHSPFMWILAILLSLSTAVSAQVSLQSVNVQSITPCAAGMSTGSFTLTSSSDLGGYAFVLDAPSGIVLENDPANTGLTVQQIDAGKISVTITDQTADIHSYTFQFLVRAVCSISAGNISVAFQPDANNVLTSSQSNISVTVSGSYSPGDFVFSTTGLTETSNLTLRRDSHVGMLEVRTITVINTSGTDFSGFLTFDDQLGRALTIERLQYIDQNNTLTDITTTRASSLFSNLSNGAQVTFIESIRVVECPVGLPNNHHTGESLISVGWGCDARLNCNAVTVSSQITDDNTRPRIIRSADEVNPFTCFNNNTDGNHRIPRMAIMENTTDAFANDVVITLSNSYAAGNTVNIDPASVRIIIRDAFNNIVHSGAVLQRGRYITLDCNQAVSNYNTSRYNTSPLFQTDLIVPHPNSVVDPNCSDPNLILYRLYISDITSDHASGVYATGTSVFGNNNGLTLPANGSIEIYWEEINTCFNPEDYSAKTVSQGSLSYTYVDPCGHSGQDLDFLNFGAGTHFNANTSFAAYNPMIAGNPDLCGLTDDGEISEVEVNFEELFIEARIPTSDLGALAFDFYLEEGLDLDFYLNNSVVNAVADEQCTTCNTTVCPPTPVSGTRYSVYFVNKSNPADVIALTMTQNAAAYSGVFNTTTGGVVHPDKHYRFSLDLQSLYNTWHTAGLVSNFSNFINRIAKQYSFKYSVRGYCNDLPSSNAFIGLSYIPTNANCCAIPFHSFSNLFIVTCPGCITPGANIGAIDFRRADQDLGLADVNIRPGDGFADGTAQVDPDAAVSARVVTNGDHLNSVFSVFLSSGEACVNKGYTYQYLQTVKGIDLNNIYVDVDFGAFDGVIMDGSTFTVRDVKNNVTVTLNSSDWRIVRPQGTNPTRVLNVTYRFHVNISAFSTPSNPLTSFAVGDYYEFKVPFKISDVVSFDINNRTTGNDKASVFTTITAFYSDCDDCLDNPFAGDATPIAEATCTAGTNCLTNLNCSGIVDDLKYFCQGAAGMFTFIPYETDSEHYYSDRTLVWDANLLDIPQGNDECHKVIGIRSSGGFHSTIPLNDVFKNEYRNFVIGKTVSYTAEIPPGYKISRVNIVSSIDAYAYSGITDLHVNQLYFMTGVQVAQNNLLNIVGGKNIFSLNIPYRQATLSDFNPLNNSNYLSFVPGVTSLWVYDESFNTRVEIVIEPIHCDDPTSVVYVNIGTPANLPVDAYSLQPSDIGLSSIQKPIHDKRQYPGVLYRPETNLTLNSLLGNQVDVGSNIILIPITLNNQFPRDGNQVQLKYLEGSNRPSMNANFPYLYFPNYSALLARGVEIKGIIRHNVLDPSQIPTTYLYALSAGNPIANLESDRAKMIPANQLSSPDYTYTIVAEYTCVNGDNPYAGKCGSSTNLSQVLNADMQINFGWGCSRYPTLTDLQTQSDITCHQNDVSIHLDGRRVRMGATTTLAPIQENGCNEVEYTLTILSCDLGNINEANLTYNFPAGMNIVGPIEYGATIGSTNGPINTSLNGTATSTTNGCHIVFNDFSDGKQYAIKFKLGLGCSFVDLSKVITTIEPVSYCGEAGDTTQVHSTISLSTIFFGQSPLSLHSAALNGQNLDVVVSSTATTAGRPYDIVVTLPSGIKFSDNTSVKTVRITQGTSLPFPTSFTLGSNVVCNGDDINVQLRGVLDNTSCTSSPCELTTVLETMPVPIQGPVANAGPDVSICQGASTTLTGSGGSTYSWSPSIELSATNIANPQANPTATKTYTLTVTNTNGCSATDDVVVTVNPLPTVSNFGANACRGGTYTFPNASATGAVSYSWSPATDLSATNVLHPTLTVPTTGSSIAPYTLTVTAVNGCQASATSYMIYRNNPTVNAGSDVSICSGNSTSITATSTSDSGMTPSWTPTTNVGTPNSLTSTFNPTSTTNYTLTVTSGWGCVGTDQVIVTVNANPAVTNPGFNACRGSSYTFAGTTATGAVSYSWSPATNLSATNVLHPTLTVPTTATGMIAYNLTVTSAQGCTATATSHIDYRNIPVLNAGSDVSICLGSSTTITATTSESQSSQFSWTPTSGVGSPTSLTSTFNPTSTTTYTLNTISPWGCTSSDQVVVTVRPLPTVNAGADVAICEGQTSQLSASGANTYSWSPNTGLSNYGTYNPTAGPGPMLTTYTVTGTGAYGCTNTDQVVVRITNKPVVNAGADVTICNGSSVVLNGSGNSYSWSPATGLSATNTWNPTANPTSTTTYTLTSTGAWGCTNSDNVVVSVVGGGTIPTPTISSKLVGGKFVFTATVGTLPSGVTATNYLWESESSPGSYTVYTTCSGSSSCSIPKMSPVHWRVTVTYSINGLSCPKTVTFLNPYTRIDFSQSEIDNKVTVYPVPAHDLLNVEYHSDTTLRNLVMYDALGREILRQDINSNKSVVDVHNIPAGVYVIHFVDGRNIMHTKRVEVMH